MNATIAVLSAIAFLTPSYLAVGAVAADTEGTAIPAELYRQGEPEVIVPKPVPEVSKGPSDEKIAEEYRRAYRILKRPRIAVYWNRSLTDRITQWFQPRRNNVSAEGQAEWRASKASALAGSGRFSASSGTQYLATDPRRAGMGERSAAAFEDAFYAPFLDAGTRLVDRSAILRLARNDIPGSLLRDVAPDRQVLETKALKDYADLLLEILLIADARAPTGFAFRVLIKKIRTGEIVGSVFSHVGPNPSAGGSETKAPLVPAPGGFVRKPKAKKAIGPDELGRRLAIETMQVLSTMPRT